MNTRPTYTDHRIDVYQLKSLLGRGSYGDVYLAEHVHRHAQFAIKLLFGFTRAEARNFIKEVSILARLKHRNIVPLVHFGTDRLVGPASSREEFPYLVMDYAPGGTLRDRFPLRQQPPLYQVPLDTVVDYIGQVAAALQCAHDDQIRAIIHCDVKPANMLVASDGRILLSDFGIGIPERITTGSLNLNGQGVLGTPLYMAPEQWNRRAEKASDQYSLAVVAYQWLAGRCPFEGKTPMQLAWQHTHAPLPSLVAQVPGLPDDVERVIFRALEKEPSRRFATVQEFADTLAGPRPGGTKPPLPPKLGKPSRRAIIVVGVSVLILASGGFAWLVIDKLDQTHPSSTSTPSPTPTPGSLLYIYSKHRDSVNAVAWSLDDTYIASGSDDGTVRVWNATTGVDRFPPYEGHSPFAVHAVAWSPDGKRIASASEDKTVQVWDAVTDTYRLTYKNHRHPVDAVAWSSDDQYIASGSLDGTVRVWDITTSMDRFPPYEGHYPYAVYAVAWSPDGKRIASTGNDMKVQVWNATNGTHLFTYPVPGHGLAVTWSPNSQYIASGGDDKTVQVWNATTGVDRFPPYARHSPFAVRAVAWSPDGKRIASGGDDMTVQVWDATNGTRLFTYSRHKKEVRAVAWSHDGRHIASAGRDGTVQIWTTG